MFTEGDLDPGPDAGALRVGLSARSVYRYFEDRGELLRAATARASTARTAVNRIMRNQVEETRRLLRVHRGLSSEETSTVLKDALGALLASDRPNHPITPPRGSRHG